MGMQKSECEDLFQEQNQESILIDWFGGTEGEKEIKDTSHILGLGSWTGVHAIH